MPILDAFTREIGVQVLPFTEAHWRLAAEGFLRYGKGRHAAALNFGNCIRLRDSAVNSNAALVQGRRF
jgi:ribonuclease VapC